MEIRASNFYIYFPLRVFFGVSSFTGMLQKVSTWEHLHIKGNKNTIGTVFVLLFEM